MQDDADNLGELQAVGNTNKTNASATVMGGGTIVASGSTEKHAAALRSVQQLALQVLLKEGELREELLPIMWNPLGQDADDYGELLQLMCACGALFLTDNSIEGRRWVMPMRLPTARPPDLIVGASDDGATNCEQLTLSYPIGKNMPAGLVERLMAGLYGVGRYVKSWRTGTLIELAFPNGALLLIELHSSKVKLGDATEAAPKKLTAAERAMNKKKAKMKLPTVAKAEVFGLETWLAYDALALIPSPKTSPKPN